MSFLNVISLLAGLAFFLYGITLMGDGLNLVAGNRLEAVLFRLTSSRARGILLSAAVSEVVDMAVRAFEGDEMALALQVEPLEEVIDNLCDPMRNHHIDRLQQGICTLQHGFVFNDLLTNFERVGDHCSNTAVAMIELEHDLFDTHEYVDSLKLIRTEAFEENYEHFRAKYSID